MPDEAKPNTPAADTEKLSPRWRLFFIALVVVVNLPLLALAFRPSAETTVSIGSGFTDDFNRTDLGPNYFATGAYWRIVNGELFAPGAKNNPLWLQAVLPDNVQIELDARSESPDGDIKCELFGDGHSHASGYVLLFGTANNTVTSLARLDERAPVVSSFSSPQPNQGRIRVERRDQRVENGRNYHWLIRRQGQTLTWQIDGQTMFEVNDPEPFKGSGHDRLALSSWDANVFFDNLKITPL
jgi:hypothetical protein